MRFNVESFASRCVCSVAIGDRDKDGTEKYKNCSWSRSSSSSSSSNTFLKKLHTAYTHVVFYTCTSSATARQQYNLYSIQSQQASISFKQEFSLWEAYIRFCVWYDTNLLNRANKIEFPLVQGARNATQFKTSQKLLKIHFLLA